MTQFASQSCSRDLSHNDSVSQVYTPSPSYSPADQMQSTPLPSPHSSPTRSYNLEDSNATTRSSNTSDNTTASITNSTLSEQPSTSIQAMVRHELNKMQKKTIIRKEIKRQMARNKSNRDRETAVRGTKRKAEKEEEVKRTRELDDLLARAYVYITNEDEMRALEVDRLHIIINQQRSTLLALGANVGELAQDQHIVDSDLS
jgi:hypothetical protein